VGRAHPTRLVNVIDPWGDRSLTKEERELAQHVYGDSIDYDAVTVHEIWPFGDWSVSPGNQIWMNVDYDFSKQSWQATFLHEMMHVWQNQHGDAYVFPALWETITGNTKFKLSECSGKKLDDYNYEQQANLVRSLYWAVAGVNDISPYLPLLMEIRNRPLTTYGMDDYLEFMETQ